MNELAFVTFQPDNGQFRAFLPLEELISSDSEPESVIKKAAVKYEHSIKKMRSIIMDIENIRLSRKSVPARNIWQLGDTIFELTEELKKISLQIDGIYSHLERDLGVKRKWLEKVIIFRRYIPNQDRIPALLNWGRCEKGTRRVAEKLRDGLYVDKPRQ